MSHHLDPDSSLNQNIAKNYFFWATDVDGPGSSDAIADAKRKVLFYLRGPPRGPPTTQNVHKLRRRVRRGRK